MIANFSIIYEEWRLDRKQLIVVSDIFFIKLGKNEFVFIHLFFKAFIYFGGERGRKRERKGEKHQCMVAFHTPPSADMACNLGMCPELGIEPATLQFADWHSVH